MEGDDMIQFDLSDDTPVYVISVAAQLSGLHAQTLRAYDRLGLVSPGRSAGGGRRYSLRDVLALREVQRLSQEEGVNLSGIKRILELEDQEQRNRVRLAGLLRSRNKGADLVPVRRSDVSVTAQPPAGAARSRDGRSGAGTLGRTAELRETNDG
jgi:MerR family transcriptional regulator/heat shock protein HspR